MTLLRRSATDLTRALALKDLRACDLMEATLDRIDAVNPIVNAIVGQRPKDALMAEAKAADAVDPVGPLHGLPFAIKD
ncbi:MAG: amidase family protein, partial [Parasphingorhabdus sp.]|uniref:amidase family protein n=1 Tax=Parasphingorhabdus sp. TaxID=2709688 RepID=UPI0032990F74